METLFYILPLIRPKDIAGFTKLFITNIRNPPFVSNHKTLNEY